MQIFMENSDTNKISESPASGEEEPGRAGTNYVQLLQFMVNNARS